MQVREIINSVASAAHSPETGAPHEAGLLAAWTEFDAADAACFDAVSEVTRLVQACEKHCPRHLRGLDILGAIRAEYPSVVCINLHIHGDVEAASGCSATTVADAADTCPRCGAALAGCSPAGHGVAACDTCGIYWESYADLSAHWAEIARVGRD